MRALTAEKNYLYRRIAFLLTRLHYNQDKEANIERAKCLIEEAVTQDAKVIVLPECFNSSYSTSEFKKNAEQIPVSNDTAIDPVLHPTTYMITTCAKMYDIWIIGGSIIEEDQGKYYSTCMIVSSVGQIMAKHRKIYLFDIDIPGLNTFKESDVLTRGHNITVVDTPYCKIGVGICRDIRFPELAEIMKERGAQLLVYPSSFNADTTGPAHFELLQRARAVDNQLWVATASPAMNPITSYKSWGHSSLVSPWGDVVATSGHDEVIVYGEIELEDIDRVRLQMPLASQKITLIHSPFVSRGKKVVIQSTLNYQYYSSTVLVVELVIIVVILTTTDCILPYYVYI